MTGVDLLVGLLLLLGVAGAVAPVLPGGPLIVLGLLVWALAEQSPTGWTVLSIGTGFVVAGAVAKYVVPGRHLDRAGVPRSTVVLGGLVGAVGFFVVPVVGLPLGFVLGVWTAELRRVGRRAAWPATRRALAAAGLSVLIELLATLLAAVTWVGGLVAA